MTADLEGASKVTVATLDGEPLRADFPLHTDVSGVPAVVIPTAEYRKLLGSGLRSLEAPLTARRNLNGRKLAPLASTIERDPEVAAFLRDRFAHADTIAAARSACLERFGHERTPSRGRISRLRSKTRRGA